MRDLTNLMRSAGILVTTLALPGLWLFWYIDSRWGESGVLVAMAALVGIPVTLLIGLMLILFLVLSQRIWAQAAGAQQKPLEEMARTARETALLQRQRERYDYQQREVEVPPWQAASHPQLTANPYTPGYSWNHPDQAIPQLADFTVER